MREPSMTFTAEALNNARYLRNAPILGKNRIRDNY